MTFAHYLPSAALLELRDAALAEGVYPKRREFLFADLPLSFTGSVPGDFSAPRDLVLSDLMYLNRIEFIDGDIVPLAVWLGNAAVHAVSPAHRELFRARQADVYAAFAVRRSTAMGPGAPVAAEALERVVHQNDMVPYAFLAGGHAAGASVARLLVPRFDGGVPREQYGTPVRYFGTGWLIGRRYLVTNHHVVNARDDQEPDATEPDLRLQASQTEVQFDYDSMLALGRKVAVEALECWQRRGELDYAVLRLGNDGGEPLRRAATLPDTSGTKTCAVNIVQHPGGAPKQLGIRNNILHRVTERDLEYFTDTEGGSSGSPVFDDSWQVVGLHKLSRVVNNVVFQGKATPHVNVATRLDRIVADLAARHPQLWNAIAASV